MNIDMINKAIDETIDDNMFEDLQHLLVLKLRYMPWPEHERIAEGYRIIDEEDTLLLERKVA
jgi:hypothetical protein